MVRQLLWVRLIRSGAAILAINHLFFPKIKADSWTLCCILAIIFAPKIVLLPSWLARLQPWIKRLVFKSPVGLVEFELQRPQPTESTEETHIDAARERSASQSGSATYSEYPSSNKNLIDLAARLERTCTRGSSRGGDLETQRTVLKISTLVSSLSATELRACLHDHRNQWRTVGYICLRALPDGEYLGDVIDCLRHRERDAPGQRWCIEIIAKALEAEPWRLDAATKLKLRKCLPGLPIGTDRRSRLCQIAKISDSRSVAASEIIAR